MRCSGRYDATHISAVLMCGVLTFASLHCMVRPLRYATHYHEDSPCVQQLAWFGVGCSSGSNATTKHVMEVQLDSNRLNGSLSDLAPGVFANLSHLELLSLSKNDDIGGACVCVGCVRGPFRHLGATHSVHHCTCPLRLFDCSH